MRVVSLSVRFISYPVTTSFCQVASSWAFVSSGLGGTMVFTDLLKEAGLGNPFEEETLRRVCAAAEKYLENYDLSGIE